MAPASARHIAVEHTRQHCNPVYERERVGNVGILAVKSGGCVPAYAHGALPGLYRQGFVVFHKRSSCTFGTPLRRTTCIVSRR